MKPLVTIVIPTCLHQAMLRECLLALAQQKLSLSQFEVIVVDQANDRATAAVVQETAFRTGMSIRYVSHKEDCVAAAYNRGWQLANSLFVAFTRDDCQPQPLWLVTALPLFHRGAEVVIGRVQHPLPIRPVPRSDGANLFCRRALLEKIGGFDELPDHDQSHEVQWLNKLAKAGIQVTSCPDAVVIRPFRERSWWRSLQHTLLKFL